MRIGFTLPIGYLAGNVTNEEDMWWQEIFGSVDECLRRLKESGITSVEIKDCREGVSPSQLRHSVEAVRDEGLEITVHGWLPKMGADCRLPPVIQELERALTKHQQEGLIPFTVHSHSTSLERGAEIPHDEPHKRTLYDLSFLSRALAPKSVLAVALELCRYKARRSDGVTFSDVLFMTNEICLENLGLCWDIGHSQANYLGQKDLRLPPDGFVEQVIHAHIHDVGPDGRTHWPVLASDGYVKDCIDILRSSGYEGVYNLELSPFRWGVSPKECRAYVETSINSMARMLS